MRVLKGAQRQICNCICCPCVPHTLGQRVCVLINYSRHSHSHAKTSDLKCKGVWYAQVTNSSSIFPILPPPQSPHFPNLPNLPTSPASPISPLPQPPQPPQSPHFPNPSQSPQSPHCPNPPITYVCGLKWSMISSYK